MKYYEMGSKFSGTFGEDLPAALQVYETLCRFCMPDDFEKAKPLTVILKDDTLSFYMRTYKDIQS